MLIKPLVTSDCSSIVAVMDGDRCPAEDFLLIGEEATSKYRQGLIQILEAVVDRGWQATPAAWRHEVDKQRGIYEFVKGPLRLFYFKGEAGQIAVCTCGVRKSGQKADKAAVDKAARLKDAYYQAIRDKTLKMVEENGT